MSSQEGKINVLMEKISILETTLLEEREKRFKYEEDLKILKTLTIPNLEKQLEEKESLCRTVFIEKIRIEKDLINEKSKNVYNIIEKFYFIILIFLIKLVNNK